jgi:ABC-type multidrug transport system ATPase subunit
MLDPNGRKEVLYAVHELNRKKGVTALLITHYMEEVADADYVYVMDGGKVVLKGTPKQVFSEPELLQEYRLDAPPMTLLAHELRKAGLPLPKGILTRQELKDELMQLYRRTNGNVDHFG